MTKSKTKISKQTKRKTNLELVETIRLAKKNSKWQRVAEIISGPRRNRKNMNLNELNKKVEGHKIVVIPGKVLSQGEIDKQLTIVALGFSQIAKEKLLKAKCDVLTIAEVIKKNPEAKDVVILK